MKQLKHDVALNTVKAVNVLLMTLLFSVCWYGYYVKHLAFEMNGWTKLAVVGIFLGLYVVFGRVYDAFVVSMHKLRSMVFSQGLAVLMADSFAFLIIWILSQRFPNMLPGLAVLAIQVLVAALWSILANKWYFVTFPPKKTLVVYDVRHGMEGLIGEYGLDSKYQVEGILSVEECLEDMSVFQGMDTVFLSGIHSHDRNIILKHCVSENIDVYVIPRVGDVLMSGAKKMHMFHLPMLRVGRYNPSVTFLVCKRLFDIVSSGAVLILVSPIMLLTAIAIKSDGGPVFYKQRRLTKDGKEFDVLKFRSMRVDAEKDGVARLSTGENDDRITPVGRIIRKFRIDELPQLLNILEGSMSVVGPRPERPEIAAQYNEEMPEFNLRLQAKAGLTGYAQVYGKYNTTPYDKLQMDLMYIASPSIWEDLKICFATIKILFESESTEGVAAGQTTAIGGGEMEKKAVR